MIAGGSTLYCLDVQNQAQVLPMKIDQYISSGDRHDILCYSEEEERLLPISPDMVQLVSNGEDFVLVEVEGGVKLRLLPTTLVMTNFGLKLAEDLAPPMEIMGLPRGTELYDQFLFVYPKPGLYRVQAPAKDAGEKRMFSISLSVPYCVVDGMVVKVTEI